MGSTQVEKPLRIFVYDSPRTCSQLFNKLFAVHPQLSHVFHPMMGASMYGPERVTLQLKHSAAAEEAQQRLAKQINLTDETYEVGAARVVETARAIEEKGKIPFFKDHIFSVVQPELIKACLEVGLGHDLPSDRIDRNPTMLIGEFFESVRPIILIRHPALSVPSFYRAEKDVFKLDLEDEDFVAMITLRWARIVYDAYDKLSQDAESGSDVGAGVNQRAIVVDASDIVYNTENLMPQLCRTLGIDEKGIQYRWNPVPRDEWPPDPIMQGFFQDMLRSDGVQRAASGPTEDHIDLDAKTAEWITEFGAKDAETLRQIVEEDLPNYEYLRKYKMTI